MNKREEKLLEALSNAKTKDLILERLWPHASVVDNCWTRNVAWVKKGEKFLEPKPELGGIGELSIVVGFKGFYGQNYEVQSTFTSEQVWNYCADLLKTKEERFDESVADCVYALNSLYSNAIEDKHASEKMFLDKSKATVIDGLYKLSRIVNRHLDEWEE